MNISIREFKKYKKLFEEYLAERGDYMEYKGERAEYIEYKKQKKLLEERKKERLQVLENTYVKLKNIEKELSSIKDFLNNYAILFVAQDTGKSLCYFYYDEKRFENDMWQFTGISIQNNCKPYANRPNTPSELYRTDYIESYFCVRNLSKRTSESSIFGSDLTMLFYECYKKDKNFFKNNESCYFEGDSNNKFSNCYIHVLPKEKMEAILNGKKK